jgi:hypothetical protein
MINRKSWFLVCICGALYSVGAFADISKQGIVDAIATGTLGDYLINENIDDQGVQQFIRHTRKHFCSVRDANNDQGNPITKEHVILGNGNWGQAGVYAHTPVLRWILNAVTDYEIITEPGGAVNTLKIGALKVKDVSQLSRPPERHKAYVWVDGILKQNTVDARNWQIACAIHLNPQMNAVRFTNGGVGVDGTAGYCYVVSRSR